MRFFIFVLIITPALAFAPISFYTKNTFSSSTKLNIHRRDVLITGVLALTGVPKLVNAKSSTFFYDDKIEEKPVEPSQMPTSGKIDLNSAFVVRKITSTFIASISLHNHNIFVFPLLSMI
jgi:hypothetical protein